MIALLQATCSDREAGSLLQATYSDRGSLLQAIYCDRDARCYKLHIVIERLVVTSYIF